MAGKNISQGWRDSQRKTYVVSHFPNDMAVGNIAAWMRQTAGKLYAPTLPFTAEPSIAADIWATSEGIKFRLMIPWQVADYVVGQLHSLIPGIGLEPEEEFPSRVWVAMAEFELTNTSQQLDMPDPQVITRSLLGSLQVKGNETIRVQWVFAPMRREVKPEYEAPRRDRSTFDKFMNNSYGHDQVNDIRGKLEHPNVKAVLRIATVADTKPHARHLLDNVRASFAGSNSGAVRFKERRALPGIDMQKRIDRATTPVNFPMQLADVELAPLLGWPLGGIAMNGLPPFRSRRLPPENRIPSEGLVIGHSTFHGSERRIAIPWGIDVLHTFLSGGTGMGKTTVMENMGAQIMRNGYGLIALELSGNLYNGLLNRIPRERLEDVILLDITDTQYPVGFNLLDQGKDAIGAVDDLIELFEYKYGNGIWADEGLQNGLRTLAEVPGLSFTDLAVLLNPRTKEETDWVDHISRNVKDPELKRYWNRSDVRGQHQNVLRSDAAISRISMLALRPELRYVMGQTKSTFQLRDVLTGNKILLVNFKTSGKAGTFAASLFFNMLWNEVQEHTLLKPNFIMIDEAAKWMDMPVDTQSMLEQGRKHGAHLIMATQQLAQLTKPGMREAIITNTPNKIIFRGSPDDGRIYSQAFNGRLGIDDFTSLDRYEAIAQVNTARGISAPVSIRSLQPERGLNNANMAIQLSRQKYGRPISEVEAEIEGRHKRPETARSRRPKISGIEFET